MVTLARIRFHRAYLHGGRRIALVVDAALHPPAAARQVSSMANHRGSPYLADI